MIDVSKAVRIGWSPITRTSGHPYVVLGNREFITTVDSCARGKVELSTAKQDLAKLFPRLDLDEVYSIFCNSVHIAKQELSQSA